MWHGKVAVIFEFSDQLLASPRYPTQAVQPTQSMNPIQSGLQGPTQVADDEHSDSLTYGMPEYLKGPVEADYLRTAKVIDSRTALPHSNENDFNKQLKMELVKKDNEIKGKNNKLKDLMEQINELKQLLQQKQQHESDSERIIEHLHAQVEEALAQGEEKAAAERYEMKSKPHGIAVIFINCEFYSIDSAFERLPTRTGSEIDKENLRVMWKYFRYEVRIHRNLTAAQMSRQLLQIAAEDHGNFDSFVCCILSHGDRGGIYGSDGQLVKISELTRLFDGTKHFCPSLVNKPKLFFIQACRGDDKDKGVSFETDNGEMMLGDAMYSSLPSQADFLLAYCTPPGHASWRSPRFGSWYISKLREVFMNNAHHHDLLSMLTMVNKELSEAYTTEGYKQCPAPVTLLRKQVWFLGNP